MQISNRVSMLAIGLALGLSTQAQAEEAPAAPPQDAPTDIIVTGAARAERRFDVSYAINSLGQADIARIAPKNFADLLGTVPGIHVEATGGEVQNITRVRGIPTDRGYLIFQQDGLPLYHEIDGVFFNSGEGMNRYDLMSERVEIVRGGPALCQQRSRHRQHHHRYRQGPIRRQGAGHAGRHRALSP